LTVAEDTMLKVIAAASAICLLLSGCAHGPAGPVGDAPSSAGIDGKPCVGSIETGIAGLADYDNAALRALAQQPTGKGALCSAKGFVVTAPVRLYRLLDSTKDYSKSGNFWALQPPTGTRDDYRAKFAICKQWSLLDRVISCEVRPGTVVVIGTTQSADCDDGVVYPKTAANQVFVPNDGRNNIIHTGACSEAAVWPPGGG